VVAEWQVLFVSVRRNAQLHFKFDEILLQTLMILLVTLSGILQQHAGSKTLHNKILQFLTGGAS